MNLLGSLTSIAPKGKARTVGGIEGREATKHVGICSIGIVHVASWLIADGPSIAGHVWSVVAQLDSDTYLRRRPFIGQD